MADEVVRVQPLHDDDDRAIALVVEPAVYPQLPLPVTM
jgi:hypothetical protein